ncbi:hypothetical protein [Streptomyces sp. NPDC040750]|uniref:hypothetical protein n=1 Tax=Streptomyces sp. NPDC040750 TaxID=3154491 RepID=UPI0033D5FDE7
MLLWDFESEGWNALVSGMTEGERRDLSLSCIEDALMRIRPSFESAYKASTVRFLNAALQDFRAHLQDVGSTVAVQDEEAFFDDLHALPEEDPALGLAALVMAFSEYADCLRNRPLGSAEVLGILSSCYEAVLNEERIPRVTPDAERDNENCRGVIDAQREMVLRFAGR